MRQAWSNIRKTAVLAILVLVTFGSASGAGAQSPAGGLQMAARAAFGGYFKYGEWLPVWVELENNGPDLEAEVRVQVTGNGRTTVFAVPVELPSVSRKKLPVYVLPNNFSREIEIQLVSGADLLVSQRVKVFAQPNISYSIGLVAPRAGPLSLLKTLKMPGQERPKVLTEFSLEDLPERVEGLQSFDCLILNDVDSATLTPAQGAALENWVQQGGYLVIGGGAGAKTTLAGLPEALQPVAPQADVLLDHLTGIAAFAGAEEIRVPGPFVVSSAGVKESRLLADQDGLPLVLERSLGTGAVIFIALDLSSSPFDAWTGTTAFWEKLLAPGAVYPEWLPPDMSLRQQRAGQMPYALTNLPVLDLPSARGLALLLAVYILLVGPVNYLVLRRQKRLHWAWVTIPVITALFSAGAFGVGYAMHGIDLVVNKIAVIDLQPGGTANVTSYLGIFSPGQQVYEVQVEGNGLLSPLAPFGDPWSSSNIGPLNSGAGSELVFVQGNSGVVRGLTVNQWSMQSIMTESVWPDFGLLSGELQLTGDALVGMLQNQTPYALQEAVLIFGRQFVRLGELPAGSEMQVEFGLAGLIEQDFGPPLSYRLFEDQFNNPGPTGPPREAELKRMVIESLFERGPWSSLNSSFRSTGPANFPRQPVLLGWLNEAPPNLLISGKKPAQQTTALLVTSLPYRLPDSGAVSLPPGFVSGKLSQLPREGGQCGEPGITAVFIGSGEAEFEFQLPETVQALQVDELKLALRSDGGWWQPPQTFVYDWELESWTELQGLNQGVNIIENPASMISELGLFRLRLSNAGSFKGCYFVDLGLQASQPAGQEGQP